MGRHKKIINQHDEVELNDEIFNILEKPDLIVEEKQLTNEEPEEKVPFIDSPDWTPYVLSKLEKDELFNGCPIYEGLRRICYDLLGTIVDIDIDVKQSPNVQNGNHSCVVAKITIEHPHDFYWLKDIAGKTIRYSQVGDIFHGNGNNDQFAWRFSSATCWTRVKASLLRDTFRLKYVYTKEEMSEISEEDSGSNGFINPNQIDGLDMICRRINVDAAKFIRGIWKHLRPSDNTDDLNNAPFSIAVQCFAALQNWQRDQSIIKPEVLGYNENWKKSLIRG